MDFELSDRCKELRERLLAFMDEHVYPAEAVYHEQLLASGDPHSHPPVMEELKDRARELGLWNLFLPEPSEGVDAPGLSNVDYAPLAEIMGRSHIASEACNCAAPDTGNMEVLNLFGTTEQKERWLRPLLDGEIRSAFVMTEPEVASSDAANIELRIERDGDEYVLNGHKWWASGALREESSRLETFSHELEGGLEYPQYTRPAAFRGWTVPEVLLSGDHARIEQWRREQSASRTAG